MTSSTTTCWLECKPSSTVSKKASDSPTSNPATRSSTSAPTTSTSRFSSSRPTRPVMCVGTRRRALIRKVVQAVWLNRTRGRLRSWEWSPEGEKWIRVTPLLSRIWKVRCDRSFFAINTSKARGQIRAIPTFKKAWRCWYTSEHSSSTFSCLSWITADTMTASSHLSFWEKAWKKWRRFLIVIRQILTKLLMITNHFYPWLLKMTKYKYLKARKNSSC